MFIFGNLFIALAKLTEILLTAVFWLVFVRAFISWFSPDPFNPIVQFLHRATEPILEPVRGLFPFSGIDWSPLVVMLGVVFLEPFLVSTLYDIGVKLKFSG